MNVVRIPDGDTVVVEGHMSIRFAYIDCAETAKSAADREAAKRDPSMNSQFRWGESAKEFVQAAIQNNGNKVQVQVLNTDQYGRKVGLVYAGNDLLQYKLVKKGLAVVYHSFTDGSPTCQQLKDAERLARTTQRGVWGDSDFVMPWDFRRQHKKH
eukprot:TRINITY_DN67063_c2_g10_i1.p1 TRINITY_DN67063_c2_g10~~TRINITY_DN67063_c2_g10_i1.p1  ORF type:complete len:155 (-),score=21.23 TRINITY_DN67063_c2_g10_i1:110-574(-)